MKRFTSYLDAARYCQRRGIALARIVRRSLFDFRIARAA